MHRVKNYLEETNVQLGASYNVAKQSTETFDKGMEAAARFVNADTHEIGTTYYSLCPGLLLQLTPFLNPVIGPSTTQLFSNLSQVLGLPPNSELVLSGIDHEANISAWVRLAKLQNHTIKWWKPSSTAGDGLILTPQNLRPLLSEKTKLVTCTHTSNVLGTIHDIKAIADEVHKIEGARLCVDGVALAPHREVDMKALDVDFYSFSWYKVRLQYLIPSLFLWILSCPVYTVSNPFQVYGPHIAILYASSSAQKGLGSLGHYFHTGPSLTTKLGLASASYELVAAIPSVVAYFGSDRKATWAAIAAHEETLQAILLEYLNKRSDCTIYGVSTADKTLRVPVISFGIEGRNSKDVVDAIELKSNFGCRWGDFYSKRLVDEVLGLGDSGGVVRVSMVHYNTEEEIRRFVKVLSEVLEGKGA